MIPFGILGLVIIYILNPFFYNILNLIPTNIASIISIILLIILIIDMVVSFKVISKVTNTVKKVTQENKKDDTYEITAKAREILKSNWKGKRILDAFPDLEAIKEKVKKVASDTAEKSKKAVEMSKKAIEKGKKVASKKIEIKKKDN